MPPAAQQQGDSGSGSSMDSLWIAVIFVIFCIFIWWGRHYWLPYVLWLKLGETILIGKIVSISPNLIETLRYSMNNVESLTPNDVNEIMLNVGQYYKWPIAIFLWLLSVYTFFTRIGSKFNRSYTMKMLADCEKENWPQIIPALKQDLINMDINEGPWASAMNPLEFAKKHNLLIVEKNTAELKHVENHNKYNVSVDRQKAQNIFIRQLGFQWSGFKALPKHTRALFAIFAAAINGDRDSAFDLLRKINLSMEYRKKPDFSGYKQLLKKHANSKAVKEIISRHAYVLTLMPTMLELSRASGVLATADFIWLKPLDRTLWYVLNNVGRRASFPEVAGIFSHWQAEKRMKMRMISSMIPEAITAIELAIADIIYEPDQDNEA